MSAGTARLVITVARQQLDELVKSGRIRDELAGDITEKLRRSTASIDRRLPDGLSAISRELRSEEHTSALQSLMRIPYAVFFLTIHITSGQSSSTASTNAVL